MLFYSLNIHFHLICLCLRIFYERLNRIYIKRDFFRDGKEEKKSRSIFFPFQIFFSLSIFFYVKKYFPKKERKWKEEKKMFTVLIRTQFHYYVSEVSEKEA